MTRVALDLLWLRPGVVGGTETYATRLIGAVRDQAPAIELQAIAPNDAIAAHPDTIGSIRAHGIGASTGPIRRVFRQQTAMRRALTAIEPELVHHLGGTVPGHRMRSVVTIHDLQPLDQPGSFSPLKVAWLRRALPAAVYRAAAVCCPSDWVAARVVERLGVNADRVHTVSVPAPVAPSNEEVGRDPADDLDGSLRQIVARGPIILYPAMTLQHKNHRTLFEAFAAVSRDRSDLQLVCCGAIGRDHEDLVELAAARSPAIHLVGHMAASQLQALYRIAERVVFPSTYEGFGLPVVEAQQAGTPVAVSNSTALPDVAGGGARLVDPLDVDAWATVLSAPPDDEDRRLVDIGRHNAARFTPQHTAAAQVAAYRQALAT